MAVRNNGRTTKEVIAAAGCSRETFRRIERGDSTKLSTLKTIIKAMGGMKHWNEIVAAWVMNEMGDEARYFTIKPKSADAPLESISHREQFNTLLDQLTHEQRLQLLKAMGRPEIVGCLKALNSIHEATNPTPASS